jgi:hypothetical protein
MVQLRHADVSHPIYQHKHHPLGATWHGVITIWIAGGKRH